MSLSFSSIHALSEVLAGCLALTPVVFTYPKIGSDETDLLINSHPHIRRPHPRILIASIVRLLHHGQGDSAPISLTAKG
jgi:hypothetical protein